MKDNSVLLDIDFLNSTDPLLLAQYEIWCMTPEELIDKQVIAIRSGFSCSNGGQVMLVDSVVKDGDKSADGAVYMNDHIVLKPTSESFNNENGWLADPEDKHNAFVLDTPENRKILKDLKIIY